VSDPDIIAECRERIRECEDSTSEIRHRAFEDLKFSLGDQWPPELITQRQLELEISKELENVPDIRFWFLDENGLRGPAW
jgi:hypothetical protein